MLYNKKIYYIASSIFLLIIIFTLSYLYGFNKLKSYNLNSKGSSEVNEKYVNAPHNDDSLAEDAKIILKLRKRSSGKEFLVKEIAISDIKSLFNDAITKSNLVEYYDSLYYRLEEFSNKEVVFVKDTNFEPDKYYLGVTKDGYLAVFKCSKEGELIIEDESQDVSNRKVSDLPKSDIQFIMTFYHEFNSKEEARDGMIELCS
jgi:hypothetical protein